MIIYIVIQINKRSTLQRINVYSPKSFTKDEDVIQLYEEITRAKQQEKSHYVIVIGDFNQKIGKKVQHDNEYIGNCSLGLGNSKGDMLSEFLRSECLYCLNTFFKSPQR